MSHNDDGTTSPPQFEKLTTKREHSPSSPDLSEDSKLNEPHPKRELDENITNQSTKATSTEDNLKKLESLNKRVDFLKYVLILIYLSVFVFSFLSIFNSILPDKVMDVELYSLVLIFHSLSFLALLIVHYQLAPRLFDERCIVSSKIQGLMPFLPAYHRSKDEWFWCYMRILLAILTDAVMWLYLNHIHVQNTNYTSDELLIYGMLSGVLISFTSFYVMAKIGPAGTEAILEQQREEQREDVSDKSVNLQMYELFSELKAEKIEETIRLRTERLEMKNENKRLKREIEELSSKNKRLPTEDQNSEEDY